MKALIAAALFFTTLGPLANAAPSHTIDADDSRIRWSGRTLAEQGAVRFGYPGVNANMRIDGGTLTMTAHSSKPGSLLSVVVDGGEPRRLTLSTEPQRYRLLEDNGKTRTVRVTHLSETWRGIVTVEGFALNGGDFLAPPSAPERKLLVIGDSVTCGEGVYTPPELHCEDNPRQPDAQYSYGMRLGRALNAETQLVCYGGRGVIRSWDGSTDQLQAPQFFELTIPRPGGPEANLQDFIPDAIVISLGTNDFSLGIGPLPEEQPFVDAYATFVERLHTLYPKAAIALTEGAIVNDDADPARPQKSLLRDYIGKTVARIDSKNVVQINATHYPGDHCDAHPTDAQHKKMANELRPPLRQLLKSSKLQ